MKFSSVLLMALSAAVSFAQDTSVVRWQTINGLITAPGIDNPVAGFSAGGGPWTTTGGSARVDLKNGNLFFFVDGLVLAGGNAIGTPGAVANVIATVVCNAGTATQQVLETPAIPLSADGNAHFSGALPGVPSCSKPLFLVRAGAHWIANGAVLTTGPGSNGNGY